jgi:hypothetical protein
MLIAYVTPAPHQDYPAITGLPFHLRHEDNPQPFIPCECGGEQFVYGSTPDDWFCTTCRGLVMGIGVFMKE